MTSANELLQEGITAARAKKADEALALLKQVVELEPRNETAWLWLSGVVQTDEQRAVCLENVLAVNPDNELAQKGLAVLRRRASTLKPLPDANGHVPEAVTVEPARGHRVMAEGPVELEGPVRAPAASLGGVEPEPSSKDRETKPGCGWGWLLVGGGGGMLLVLVALVVAWAFGLVELPGLGLPVLQRAPFMSSEPGSLSGTVSWETMGAGSIVVTGITVKVWAADGLSPIATGITDASGNYSIANILPGEYRVSAHQYPSEVGEQIAHKCWVIDGVVIESGRTTQVFLNPENSLLEVQMDYHPQECR